MQELLNERAFRIFCFHDYLYIEEDRYIPPRKLTETRSFRKYLLLGILTLGIYNIIFFISFSFDLG